MNADQLERILERIGISQRSAARRLGINERTMRKYIAGDAAIPRTVSLALERLRIDREHEALLAELRGAREAVGAPFAQTTRKFRAIAEGKSRENPTLAEIRTASDAMDRFEKARKRLQQFFDENRATYIG
jgi:transcriptional regulator with XRE-family HTH domain